MRKIRKALDRAYDPGAYATRGGGELLTKQSMRDETDINRIVERHRRTGLVTHLNARQPLYLDVSEMGDFREHFDRVQRVRDWFNGLPAELRDAYDNDPRELLEDIAHPTSDTRERLEAYGLLEADSAPTATPDPVPDNPEAGSEDQE